MVKIGRSDNPEKRCANLQAQMPFFIRPAAIFNDIGYLESEVHRILHGKRVRDCPGREWFYMSVQEASETITRAMGGR